MGDAALGGRQRCPRVRRRTARTPPRAAQADHEVALVALTLPATTLAEWRSMGFNTLVRCARERRASRARADYLRARIRTPRARASRRSRRS